jgi:hypothetical protein
MHLVKELHHGGAAFGILDCGDKSPWLVKDKIAKTLSALKKLSIHANVIPPGIGFGAQLSHSLTVDLDAALLDHLFSFASAGNTGLGKNLLQAFELGWGPGLEFRHVFVIELVFSACSFGI